MKGYPGVITIAVCMIFCGPGAAKFREANLSDMEVREIENVIAARYPGALTMIEGVLDRCWCEEKGICTAQVEVLVRHEGQSRMVTLSRVDGLWGFSWRYLWRQEVKAFEKRCFEGYDRLSPEAQEKCPEEFQALMDRAPQCPAPRRSSRNGDSSPDKH